MFQRLGLRTSRALVPLLKKELAHRTITPLVVRASSNIAEVVKNWEKAHEKYYNAQRDTKNFPHPVQPEKCPPVRLGFIPDTWFTAFYEKTGVTGPYVFGAGLLATLLSSELWIIEHHFFEFLTFWLAVYIVHRKYGQKIANALESAVEEANQATWHQPKEAAKAELQTVVADGEKAIWQEAGQKYIFEAKRENVALQLEAEYRQRIEKVHNAVKKRLDYHIEVENTKSRFEQTHMTNWIINSVVKSITPQQERDSITNCIKELKVLASR